MLQGSDEPATVVTRDAGRCASLVDALRTLGYAAAMQSDLGRPLAGGVVCLDAAGWLARADAVAELAAAWPQAPKGFPPGLMLLFDADAQPGAGADGGLHRLVRSLAHRLAPRARVNAIQMDARAAGLKGALRLVLECPGMTGQTLALSSAPGRVQTPCVELGPPPGEARTAGLGIRRMFIRDLVLSAFIGVHRHEKAGRQRVRLNVDMEVLESELAPSDRLGEVVCYETMAERIRQAALSGHVNLVETLAERVAGICLTDPRVLVARVRIEKLDIFQDAVSAGVEIERRQTVR